MGVNNEDELAFEIFEVENSKKVNIKKIYLNGRIEGFEGNPCIVNHIFSRIVKLQCIIKS